MIIEHKYVIININYIIQNYILIIFLILDIKKIECTQQNTLNIYDKQEIVTILFR